jgi:hypothetical protein
VNDTFNGQKQVVRFGCDDKVLDSFLLFLQRFYIENFNVENGLLQFAVIVIFVAKRERFRCQVAKRIALNQTYADIIVSQVAGPQ